MTGYRGKFISFRKYEGGKITFGDGSKANIEGKGTVELNTGLTINEVSYARSLDFNLLSIRQLCGNGKNEVTFRTERVVVRNLKTQDVILKGIPYNNIYQLDQSYIPTKKLCLSVMEEETHLWHRRLGHAS